MRRTSQSTRFNRFGVVAALCLLAMSLPLSPKAAAQASANIEFLNPSSFAAIPAPQPDPQVPKGPDSIIVSDMQTENPETGPEFYRLSAWVSGVPQNPAVEFELLTRGGVSVLIIDNVRRVGADTFEADWDIPDTLPDGPYTMRATLADGILGIDNVDQDIVIQRVAERVEITYPDTRSGNGQYGMFLPIARSTAGDGTVAQPPPVGNIENRTTGQAEGQGPGRVRAFYTTSAPGSVPEWKVCGNEGALASWPFTGTDNGLRCTLQSDGDLPVVSAVALVANNGNINQPYASSQNQAGDATRVLEPYSQVPTKLEITTGHTASVDAGDCHLVIGSLTDQVGREVIAANMDAHAWGPHDLLRFSTGPFEEFDGQAPDRGHHSPETGVDCVSDSTDNPDNENHGEQQVVAGPDVKHIETKVAGTNDNGQWGFELWTPADSVSNDRRTTRWELWLDEFNDGSGLNNDVFDTSEMCQAGLIGWGGPPSTQPVPGTSPVCPNAPPPVCQTGQASTSQTSPCPTTSPSPTPTASPTEPPEEDSITIRASRNRVAKGKRVRFSGAIDGDDQCAPGRQIVLQSRRGGRAFRDRVFTASMSDGSWSVRKKIRKTTQWRAIAEQSGSCERLVSPIVKVRVRRS